jgi:hypothetical protein
MFPVAVIFNHVYFCHPAVLRLVSTSELCPFTLRCTNEEIATKDPWSVRARTHTELELPTLNRAIGLPISEIFKFRLMRNSEFLIVE